MLIEQFEKNLFGCRFCPMCKPYGEVGEIKKDEPHSTRVRGMLLWKILKGYAEYNEDVARIIYDSTLDTVSQAWCVNHYPVADIVLSARADIFNAGLAPDTVKNYSPTPAEEFSRELSQFNKSGASTVLYPGDAMAGDNIESTKALAEFVSKHDPQLTLPDFYYDCGAVAYCLGNRELAKKQAQKIAASLSTFDKIIVDGPLSYWFFTDIYPRLGVELSEGCEVILLSDYLNDLFDKAKIKIDLSGEKIYLLGSEFSRLTGKGYAPLRDLVHKMDGAEWIESIDGLELSSGSGAGGALHISDPYLALQVSKKRIEEAVNSGAAYLLCDSPFDAGHLKKCSDRVFPILTLAELLIKF